MKVEKKHNIRYVLKLMVLGLFFISGPFSFGQDELQDAEISVSFDEQDEDKILRAVVTDTSGVPIEDLELYFYVKRTFSLLPIGDLFTSTDENGVVEILFPKDLPGDAEGNVTIIVKILDSDLYNDHSVEMIKDWGVPTPLDQFEEERSLWAAAANAPIPLVLLVSSMIMAIWFVIGYIIYTLFKISRIRVST